MKMPFLGALSNKEKMEPNTHGLERYSRQIFLPEIGQNGQMKLHKAKVFIVGAGGLGSSCALYLAAAGIGTIGIVDDDKVELSNLNRQILHTSEQIGSLKVNSARKTLQELNPEIDIVTFCNRFQISDESIHVIRDYDVVIDCSDNFSARYTINEACKKACRPWIYGAVDGFEGQIMTVSPGRGPCYRCLYPSAPPPSDRKPAVIGIMPGILGIFQATEAIKLILGIGELLVGILLFIDLLDMNISTLRVSRNPACPTCNGSPVN